MLKKTFHLTRRKLAKIWLDVNLQITVVGVTGSYGKTSAVRAIAEVLSAKYSVNKSDLNLDTVYNLPITILKTKIWNEILVLEYGVDHLNEMDTHLSLVKPKIAVLTGVTSVHTDSEHLKSLEKAIAEKRKLIESIPEDGLAVFNYDDENSRKVGLEFSGRKVFYGQDKKADVWADKVKITPRGTNFILHDREIVEEIRTGLLGFPAVYSCLTAWVIGREKGISKNKIIEKLSIEEDDISSLKNIYDDICREIIRNLIIKEKRRVDGRQFDDIRPISCEIGILPRVHGSALFTRGQTQALVITTLGTFKDRQFIDTLEEDSSERFYLHYNFPPFSVGEVRPRRGQSRREIGHGSLAEKALKSLIPLEVEFPYTIRVVSEILESNGSSSMATVCGGSLSLMDAGVPIKRPIAGIAMGLVKENEKIEILTDILGLEDHYGDMDFKAAGSSQGITAIQMDLKIAGISKNTLFDILQKSKKARLFILNQMNEVISEPKKDLSIYAPKIVILKIDTNKIGIVIGPSGKNIKKIIEVTGATIDIKEDGEIYISSINENSIKQAKKMIESLTKEAKVGDTYKGKVTRTTNFGAFVEILPGKEGLVHISKLSHKHVVKVEDIVKVNDDILVKVIGIDNQGRIDLRKVDIEENSIIENESIDHNENYD